MNRITDRLRHSATESGRDVWRRVAAEVVEIATDRHGQRAELIRNAKFLASAAVTPVVVVEIDGVRYHLDTRDRVVSRAIYVHGEQETANLAAARTAVKDSGRDDPLAGRTFLDVGANLGTATLAALARFGASAAVTVEPHPANLALLRANVAANGLADRVAVQATAISDAPGELELETDAYNSGDHRLRVGGSERPQAYGEDTRSTIAVPVTTIDALVADGTIVPADVGLVWVDTQGHEAHVLAGAGQLLAADVPWSIVYWPYGLRAAGGLDRLHALTAEHFASFLVLGEGGASARPTGDLPALGEGLVAPSDARDLLLLR